MAPSPYLLWVNSRATAVDDDLWQKWYIEEHVPDLVNGKASTRARFYKEIKGGIPGTPAADAHPRKFLALYQTEFEEPLKSEEYLGLRKTTEMFPTPVFGDNGEFNGRNYKLIQDYDPESVGECSSLANMFALNVY